MTFKSPGALWLLVLVAGLGGAYVWMQIKRRTTYAVRFTNLALLDVVAPKRPGWRRHVAAGAFLAAAVVLVLAVARPAHDVQVPRERATIVLAIDVSLSMEATDVLPTRLESAQRAADDFLRTVPATINVGLVEFAGSSTVLVPPTTDHRTVSRAIGQLRLGEGTAIGEAIFAGLDSLALLPETDNPDEDVPASIIVLSDGETTVGRSNESAVRAAIDAQVPVSTIAFGTADGLIFIEGQPVPVPPNLDALAAIADATGGVAFAAEDEGQLDAAYADLGSSIGFQTEQREITAWFTGTGLAALLVAGCLSLLWFARLP